MKWKSTASSSFKRDHLDILVFRTCLHAGSWVPSCLTWKLILEDVPSCEHVMLSGRGGPLPRQIGRHRPSVCLLVLLTSVCLSADTQKNVKDWEQIGVWAIPLLRPPQQGALSFMSLGDGPWAGSANREPELGPFPSGSQRVEAKQRDREEEPANLRPFRWQNISTLTTKNLHW